jgi:hypothetical protein
MALAACVNPNTVPVSTKPMTISAVDRHIVETGISNAHRDPESTKFRSMRAYRLSNGDRVFCGESNAKNGFGAYVGYSPFYIRMSGSEVDSMLIDSDAVWACTEAAKGQMMISS